MSDYYLNHKALAIEYWRDMNKALAENEKLRAERDGLRVEVQAAYERGFIEASRAADHAADADLRAENETLRAEVIRLTYEKEQLATAVTEHVKENHASRGSYPDCDTDKLEAVLAKLVLK